MYIRYCGSFDASLHRPVGISYWPSTSQHKRSLWCCCHCHHWGLQRKGLCWLDEGVNPCFERGAEGNDLSSNLHEVHWLLTFMVRIGIIVIGCWVSYTQSYEAFSTGACGLKKTILCMLVFPKLFDNSVLGSQWRGAASAEHWWEQCLWLQGPSCWMLKLSVFLHSPSIEMVPEVT